MTYLYILLAGFALYAFFKFVLRRLPVLTSQKKLRDFFSRAFPILEMIAWFAYSLWVIDILFARMSAYPLILTVLFSSVIITLVWYFFRDFVSGIILRAENGFFTGQRLKLNLKGGETEGVIEKVGYRSLEISNSKGEHIKIPYTGITDTLIVTPSEKAKRTEHIISIDFTSSQDSPVISTIVKRRLMEMPWIISEEDIRIKLSHEPETDNYSVNVWFYSVTAETSIKTEEALRKFLKSLK